MMSPPSRERAAAHPNRGERLRLRPGLAPPYAAASAFGSTRRSDHRAAVFQQQDGRQARAPICIRSSKAEPRGQCPAGHWRGQFEAALPARGRPPRSGDRGAAAPRSDGCRGAVPRWTAPRAASSGGGSASAVFLQLRTSHADWRCTLAAARREARRSGNRPWPLTCNTRCIAWFRLPMSTGAAIQSAAPELRYSSISSCSGLHRIKSESRSSALSRRWSRLRHLSVAEIEDDHIGVVAADQLEETRSYRAWTVCSQAGGLCSPGYR